MKTNDYLFRLGAVAAGAVLTVVLASGCITHPPGKPEVDHSKAMITHPPGANDVSKDGPPKRKHHPRSQSMKAAPPPPEQITHPPGH